MYKITLPIPDNNHLMTQIEYKLFYCTPECRALSIGYLIWEGGVGEARYPVQILKPHSHSTLINQK